MYSSADIVSTIPGMEYSAIAADLVTAFENFCGENGAAASAPSRPEVEDAPASTDLPPTFRSIL